MARINDGMNHINRGEKKMEKKVYEDLSMEVIVFDSEDIIVTSGNETGELGV